MDKRIENIDGEKIRELERKIFAILIILTCVAFGVSLLLSGLGSFIELRAEKKDREINISLDSKTWILDNGQVVISDEQNYRSIQQYDPKTRLPIADAPFKDLKIIQKVYSITRDGRIFSIDQSQQPQYFSESVYPFQHGCCCHKLRGIF